LTFDRSIFDFLFCLENPIALNHINELHTLLRNVSHTHTHCMSWVIYLKFLSARKFVLIEFLTLNYIFAYFLFAISLSYQLFIHECSKANFRKNYYFCKFFSVFSFSIWSVWTDLAYSLNACGPVVCCSGKWTVQTHW